MVQTAIKTVADKAFPGLSGDIGSDTHTRSLAMEGGTVKFGHGMVVGTDPLTQAKLPSAAGERLAGVLLFQQQTQDAAAADLVAGEVGSLMRKGRVWVVTDEVVAPGDPVFIRHSPGATSDLGSFRNDADTVATVDKAEAVPSAEFLEYDATSGVALLEINLP